MPRKSVTAFCCLLAFLAFGLPARAESDFKVTLLGTSSPSPRPDRMGPSTLVEAGGQRLLFDAGRGVPIRLWQLRVPMGSINALFITTTIRITCRASPICG